MAWGISLTFTFSLIETAAWAFVVSEFYLAHIHRVIIVDRYKNSNGEESESEGFARLLPVIEPPAENEVLGVHFIKMMITRDEPFISFPRWSTT